MITSAEEYYASLYKIEHPELAILLPSTDENIYSIDLDSRTIETPEFISVVQDHKAEIIYFMVDRFYDNADLSTMACLIQYVNAAGEVGYYRPPYYDTETYAFGGSGLELNKMLVPWCIEGKATKAAGEITFAIRFFKTNQESNGLSFNLSTVPAKSKVLYGMDLVGYYSIVVANADEFAAGKYYVLKDGKYELAASFDANEKYFIHATGDYNFTAAMYQDLDLKLDDILSKIANANRELSSVDWIDL